MKIKSFECPKSIRNYETKILQTLGRRVVCPIGPAYYIVDWRILNQSMEYVLSKMSLMDHILFLDRYTEAAQLLTWDKRQVWTYSVLIKKSFKFSVEGKFKRKIQN